MPKEILDAVNLQPQYRTFVEIRDCMFQQARLRARERCVPSNVNTSTNNSAATKNTTHVPMDVSKYEAEGQGRVPRISTSKIRIVTKMNCVLSRAKVKVVSRELASNVVCEGTRLTDAGRKRKGDWEKGKGGYKGNGRSKGKACSKGEWSNPGHTWDNSWYHSNWHGKAYGLEGYPWAAVESVPQLCAVSLKPSCEEFSEPKHVRKGHCTNTLLMKCSGTFALVNRFSILA